MNNQNNSLNPWLATRTRTGAEYDAPYEQRASEGIQIHGEANLVEQLLEEIIRPNTETEESLRVLDAGCGTGRIAIELAQRGYDIVGVDLDEVMLVQAKHKAPDLNWLLDDLSAVTFDTTFDAVVMAGNVMIYVTPGSERAVLENMTSYLNEGGILLSAFELTHHPWTQLTIDHYDAMMNELGMQSLARWSTWEQDVWQEGDMYVVRLHQKSC